MSSPRSPPTILLVWNQHLHQVQQATIVSPQALTTSIADTTYCDFLLALNHTTTQLATLPPQLCLMLISTRELNLHSKLRRPRWSQQNPYCNRLSTNNRGST